MQKELLVTKNTKSGFSLVEIILSIALFALLLTAIAGFYIYGQQSSITYGERSRAYAIAEQALEAIKNIKDTGFNNIAIGTYGLGISQSGSWELLPGTPDVIEELTRTITIEELDANTKKVTITITQTINSVTKEIATLTSKFTNWMASSFGGWDNPSKEFSVDISSYEISYDRSRTYTYDNYACTIINNDNKNLFVFNMTNSEPPVILDLFGKPNDISIYNGFAYITSDTYNRELQIINTSNLNNGVIAHYVNPDGPMRSIFIQNDLAYILSYSKLLILDISDPVSPKSLGEYAISGNDIYVSGKYAYISNMQDASKALLILDISDPSSIKNTGYVSVGSGATISTSIIVSGDTAIMSYDNMLYTVNVSNKENPVLFDPGNIDLKDTIYDVALNLYDSRYVFIGTGGKSGFGFSVINIENPATPTILSHIPTSPGGEPLLGLYYDGVRNKVFGLGLNQEFMAIQPTQ